MVNSRGVKVGPNGYVVCGVCGGEAQDVSRETPREYAYHVRCNPTVFGYVDQRERFQAFLEKKHHEHS